jgi:ubiquinone/menaquinone biosynthesis C-methylase UbiE
MDEQQQAQSTYFFDPESTAEMARLIEQDRTMTKAMGGPLAGLPDLPSNAQVVDLACGPGSWVLDTAYALPDSEIAGVDISRTMIDYANARARSQELTNASFGTMNITEPLDFSNHSFDLVNARTLFAVLHRNAWQPFLAECTRILKPSGILRLTEPVDIGVTNSAAAERLIAALVETLWKFGYSFSVDGRSFGLLPVLSALMREAGYQKVQIVGSVVEFSANTPAWVDFYNNYRVTLLQSKPLFLKGGVITEEEFDQCYQQMFIDMNLPDFRALATFASVIGIRTA